jgi:hypothetical protein
MARKSNALIATQAATVVNAVATRPDMNPAMQAIVGEIGNLFSEAQEASVTAFWQIGQRISMVAQDPDKYLTAAQKAAQVDPTAVLISQFTPTYSIDQLRAAETFYERYPSERALKRLLELRSPGNPTWRISTSHVNLLTQIADDEKRAALEEKCAEEALTVKTLATELQEQKGGKTSNGGRPHKAPAGLKNQLHDFVQAVRRFVGRSESLWLGEENLYDAYVNSSPTKREGVPAEHWAEIGELLTKLSDCVGDHVGMYNKALEALEPADKPAEENDDEEDSDLAASARRAAAAAAAARRKNNITR